ncbi:hypothetical protein FRAAL3627 [Frankia alni ACN14a]|uniref:Uncharacterized protein n=1 Tax=Frankia alni (strain DSM 45986 / CECT 9034 / ACN14a) TaxID=326424 RepID=Q0RJP2_FRAAA|nr:hypothetical protein FRAAL3627 [Frankia alni ACN14a]
MGVHVAVPRRVAERVIVAGVVRRPSPVRLAGVVGMVRVVTDVTDVRLVVVAVVGRGHDSPTPAREDPAGATAAPATTASPAGCTCSVSTARTTSSRSPSAWRSLSSASS